MNQYLNPTHGSTSKKRYLPRGNTIAIVIRATIRAAGIKVSMRRTDQSPLNLGMETSASPIAINSAPTLTCAIAPTKTPTIAARYPILANNLSHLDNVT